MKKTKLFAVALSSLMALTTMSLTAFAGETSVSIRGGVSTESSTAGVATVTSSSGTNATYSTLEEAIKAVQSGDTVTLLGNSNGNGVVVPSGTNFTLDLGGYTYTIDGTTVGSTGTETNGFQLLKDSNITIKNGKIESKAAIVLIQNYSNLTLDGVTLDGSKLGGATPYTLSNNNGNVQIKNSTIIGSDNGYAFDVCDYSTYAGAIVTLSADSVINGKIQISDYNGGEVSGKLIIGGTTYNTVGDYVQTENGTIAKIVATTDGVGYTSLEAAIAAVKENSTVTLLENSNGNGVKVPSETNFTLDLGGYTYTIDGTTVGSTGTETNGFQLLKDSNITIKNGTITSTKAKKLIQNYSNLTLENVTLDGSQLVGTTPYTLSNNNGEVKINNSTIIGSDNGYAFDVCDYSTYAGTTVTVDSNSEIDGLVQISNHNKGDMNSKLVVGETEYTEDGDYVQNTDGTFKNTKEEEIPSFFQHQMILVNMNSVEKNGETYNPVCVYAGIDSLDYKEVGFEFSATNGKSDVTFKQSTTTVYKEMNITGTDGVKRTYNASILDGAYMFGNRILFTPENWTNDNTTIWVKPYAVKYDGTTIYGRTTTISDQMVKENNPNSALFKKQEVKE